MTCARLGVQRGPGPLGGGAGAAQQQQQWPLGAGAGREQLQQPSPVQRGPGPLGGGAGAAQQQQLWLLGAGAGREQLQQPSPVQRGPGPLGGGAGAAQQQQQWPLGAGAGREQLQQPSPVQRGPGPLGGGAGAAQQQQQWPSLGQPELGPLGGGAGAAQQLQHWPSLGQPELGPWGGGAGAVQQQQQWPSLGQPGLGPWGGGASAVPQPPASSLQQAPYSVQGLILPPQQQYAPIPLASGPTSQQYASVQLVQPQAPPGDQGRHDQKKAGQREQVPGLKHVPIGARPWPKLHTPSEVYDMYVHGRQADGWPALQQMESDYGSTWRSGFRQRWSEVMEVINLISKTATTVGCTKKEAAAFWTEKQVHHGYSLSQLRAWVKGMSSAPCQSGSGTELDTYLRPRPADYVSPPPKPTRRAAPGGKGAPVGGAPVAGSPAPEA
ncbi:hypothetical protein PLESTB_000988800 [Pleodorina starrii]|uniref:Uncharacterized protein n=1 Tax=Pleodorina starrii TaxID=330485 RepID=A0A9W6F3S5_9CHLO|nr:hypothetical protein PLESTM_000551400 [Pleodorina starrii]GLC55453.1 hypothetical protein PLESTB_000988800 [Pleodorina starrii]